MESVDTVLSFDVEAKNFRKALGRVMDCAAKGGLAAELSGVLLVADADTVRLVCTDNEQVASAIVNRMHAGVSPWAALVAAQQVYNALRLEDGELVVTLAKDTLEFKTSCAKFGVGVMNPAKFPLKADRVLPDAGDALAVTGGVLAEAFRLADGADVEEQFKGFRMDLIVLEVDGGRLLVEGFDSKRLIIAPVPLQHQPPGEKFKVMIPRASAKQVAGTFGGDDGAVKVFVAGNDVWFVSAANRYGCRQMVGRVPDLATFGRPAVTHEYKFLAGDLLAGVKRAGAFAQDKNYCAVEFTQAGGTLKMAGVSALSTGSAESWLAHDDVGVDGSFNADMRVFTEYLGMLKRDAEVVFGLKDAKSAMLLTDGTSRCVFAPLDRKEKPGEAE